MTSLLPFPILQFFNNDGTPLVGGTVTTLVPNTSVSKTTWQDRGRVTANTNPIHLNSAGRAPPILGAGDYEMVVRDSLGNTLWSGLSSSPLPDDAISDAMLPVVGAATTATAIQLMGIPAYIATVVSEIALLPGPTGPMGPAGPQGVIGPTGPASPAGTPLLNGGNPGFLQLQNVNNSSLNFFDQFGQSATNSGGVATVNFAVQFPNACLGVQVTVLSSLADVNIAVNQFSTAGVIVTTSSIAFHGGGFGGPVAFMWRAYGY